VTAARGTYHHGDLRNALLHAGAQLAESGGPDAVTIRAAARLAGVTPTAAYRHFADHAELLEAVRELAMQRLSAAMTRYLRSLPATDDPVAAAVDRLGSTGRGYIHFAVTEPGLFRTAFIVGAGKPDSHRPEGSGPFDLLCAALDGLVDVGYLAAEDRPLAEFAAWSAVHGLALLLIDGPLRALRRREREAVIDRALEVVHRGLATGPRAP
jgi:AcrR family transcriptional regulator